MSDEATIVETVTTLYERLFRPDLDRLRGEMAERMRGLRGEVAEQVQGLRSEMAGGMHGLRGQLHVMQADIAELKQTTAEIQADAADFHRDTDGHFDAVYQRFDHLETEYHMLVEGLRRVEKQVAAHVTHVQP